ncbi:ABC transporter permease [Geosporobacter ferrireducens]|uniref:ABC transporter permease n=1 Tax=Geosporobacter ferrireducens TaxID=1424294 RepID=A0A1D8GNZ3_9FIRM|nr:ABC transporter permease [Geosporobacter ferrireducens]AOT72605.1 hypothetical protein Gferi_25460 [Geosporobacter ferrireducens]MTI55007.1 ABC transporter permease [Geosporobacter ferrireducens]
MMKRVLSSEYIKIRRICLWIPAISAAILLLFTCIEWYLYFRQGESGVYAGLNVMYMFLSFTVLLTGSLLCSIMAETEHQSQGLKLIFSMPVSRTTFYFTKAIWIGILMLGCSLLIIGGSSVIWLVYTDQPLPFYFLVKQVLGCLAASLPVLAIQQFLSLRFHNQTLPLAVGVIGAISSLFLGRFGVKILYILPWAYPSMASPFIKGYINWIVLGAVLGMFLLWAGAMRFRALEIK